MDANEELKAEQDMTAKYKKSYSDLQQRYNSLESSYSDIHAKYNDVQMSLSSLEQTTINLQSALADEQSAKSRGFDHISELESMFPYYLYLYIHIPLACQVSVVAHEYH